MKVPIDKLILVIGGTGAQGPEHGAYVATLDEHELWMYYDAEDKLRPRYILPGNSAAVWASRNSDGANELWLTNYHLGKIATALERASY
jgi:hypothetical protein